MTASYTIYQDLWGEAQATSGSQCSTINAEVDGSLSWSTSWTWAGGSSSVKSYASAAVIDIGKLVSSISSIPTTWKWSYAGSNLVADVAYDLFTSSTAAGDNEYEIMVWLAALGGAGPISATGSAVGTTTIGGVTFKLYYGLNGSTKVYSFVAASEAESFSADLLDFFTYLKNSWSFPTTTQYLKNVAGGTEPFTGTFFSVQFSFFKTMLMSWLRNERCLDRKRVQGCCELSRYFGKVEISRCLVCDELRVLCGFTFRTV